MNKPILRVESLTYALKGKRLLALKNIEATVERMTDYGRGCGYGLRIDGDLETALDILHSQHIRVTGQVKEAP